MGFEVQQTAKLVFMEGTRLDGATVRVSLDMTLRQYTEVMRQVRRYEGKPEAEFTAEDFEEFAGVVEQFADAALVSWDLELGGEPLPARAEGMSRLPMGAQMAIFQAWSRAVSSADPNSLAGSESSEPSEPAPSDATALSSPSPQS